MRGYCILLLCLCWMACADTRTVATQAPLLELARPVQVAQEVNADLSGKPFSLRAITINGDVLTADVSYSGGCEEHRFELLSEGRFDNSYPPRAELVLTHDDGNDRCRGIVDNKLYFNLQSLRYEGTQRVELLITNNNQVYTYHY